MSSGLPALLSGKEEMKARSASGESWPHEASAMRGVLI
jgi:hypothetical protein